MKILITGGTGFIGKKLTEDLIQSGHELFIISRLKRNNEKNITYLQWEELNTGINQSDIVINLVGESIANKRWTEAQKELLYRSRIESTRLIVNAINNSKNKPRKLINASAVGIYGDRRDEIIAENSSLGSDFLAHLCKAWEAEANNANTNVVILRIGIVLGKDGGALQKMLPPFKMFIGGPLGSGNQYMSWIHVDDVVGIIKFSIENNNVTGILNATSPNPVTNKEFSNVLGKVLERPSFMPAPDFVLRILLGEMADLLLCGQRVMPKRTVELGYRFRHVELEGGLKNILA